MLTAIASAKRTNCLYPLIGTHFWDQWECPASYKFSDCVCGKQTQRRISFQKQSDKISLNIYEFIDLVRLSIDKALNRMKE